MGKGKAAGMGAQGQAQRLPGREQLLTCTYLHLTGTLFGIRPISSGQVPDVLVSKVTWRLHTDRPDSHSVMPLQTNGVYCTHCNPCCLPAVVRMMLNGPLFLEFFDKIQVANFEVASDAFSTFKVRRHLAELHRRKGWGAGVVVAIGTESTA